MSVALAAALALAPMAALSGCQSDGVRGQTLYSVSAWGGNSEEGEVSTITFAEEGDSWHYVSGNDEMTGTWTDEDGDIVLTSALWGVETLERLDDGSGYEVLGDEKGLGTRFYPSEDAAKAYCDEYVAGAAGRVQETLESSTFVAVSSEPARTTDETITFAGGSASFTKGEYEQEGYLFLQGPSEGDWTASGHSGEYTVTVEEMKLDGWTARNPQYVGTLTIDGDSVEYELTISDDGGATLSIEGLSFTSD